MDWLTVVGDWSIDAVVGWVIIEDDMVKMYFSCFTCPLY